MKKLETILRRIDGGGYGGYKALKGHYRMPGFELLVDHVQSDPFAAPSRIRVRVAARAAGFPADLWSNTVRRTALEDFLLRRLMHCIRTLGGGRRGSGKSGEIAVCPATQQVLARSPVRMSGSGVEARLTVGLPARGRTVLGRQALAMLTDDLPQIVEGALIHARLDAAALTAHVESVEDQDHLRRWVVEQGLCGFVADGALLPRKSGVDERPLEDGLLFEGPDSLARTVTLPHAGEVRGMGIPQGVTLIVGGGFHGKSTLLNALEMGVYDHVPGDGRCRVATDPTAVKVRAEDGRQVTAVDISPFIGNLPFDRDTRRFSTDNASGSTSQAAAIVEALYAGSRLLLIDEDTSATNFMIRDARMQRLVAADKEPITPFLHRVRELYEAHGVSSVIVMGGSGDYFEVADTVIMMDAYTPLDVTKEAHELAAPRQLPETKNRVPFEVAEPAGRIGPLSAARGRRDVKIDVRGRTTLNYGEHGIDLSRVAQVADEAQVRAIGWLIHRWSGHYADSASVTEGLRNALADAVADLDVLTDHPVGNLALPRLFELCAAVNRVRRAQADRVENSGSPEETHRRRGR
ncbi:MAG: ABC-ATPase domain-containing protein [Leptospirillia bacterium]